ncbi:hypothetical protein BC940DRAFT_11699 [Gongronella butleri]|nr:hypothetical protein BC940DRAFT_11699 [Gongronella butleri]
MDLASQNKYGFSLGKCVLTGFRFALLIFCQPLYILHFFNFYLQQERRGLRTMWPSVPDEKGPMLAFFWRDGERNALQDVPFCFFRVPAENCTIFTHIP